MLSSIGVGTNAIIPLCLVDIVLLCHVSTTLFVIISYFRCTEARN